jgi:hypothetical protein
MKTHDSKFEKYIECNTNENLHPKLKKKYNKFSENIKDFQNLLFYGPKGTGKYTQMLSSIKKYSPTELKYEKKLTLTYNKNLYHFKISDIHLEVDMSMLGCNSKLLWNELYNQFIDIISAKVNNIGIIVCKYFQEIHPELLDIFYSYMQTTFDKSISIKFIIITEELSFIPDNICRCCEIISVPRPARSNYNRCLHLTLPKQINLWEITNIKNIEYSITDDIMNPHYKICNKIINEIIHPDNINFLKFRDLLYEIFIYNLNITDCIWYIIYNLIEDKKIKEKHLSDILIKTYKFFQYYNNNYRPIYHLENYIFYLISIINEYPKSI